MTTLLAQTWAYAGYVPAQVRRGASLTGGHLDVDNIGKAVVGSAVRRRCLTPGLDQ